jgi:hypothetical protein
MKYLLICCLFISCNVVKTLTGGETDPSDSFFNGEKQPEKNLIFMACESNNPCFLDTSTSEVTIMDLAITTPEDFYVYDGYVFYRGWNGTIVTLFRYNLADKTNEEIELNGSATNSNAKSFQEFNGKLYFWALTTAEASGTFCEVDGGSANPVCKGTHFGASFSYLITAHYNGGSKLFACYNSAGMKLHTVDVNSGSFAVTLEAATTGGPDIPCTNSPTAKGYMSSGYIFEADGTDIYRYNISSKNLESANDGGATFDALNVSYDGNFYFSDSTTNALHVLKQIDSIGGYGEISMSDAVYNPSNRYVEQGPGQIIFTDNDGNGQTQVYTVPLNDYTEVNALTSFDGSENILFMAGLEQGLVIFDYGEIMIFGSNGYEEIIPYNITNGWFKLVRSYELNGRK